jgi:hypothetical protein
VDALGGADEIVLWSRTTTVQDGVERTDENVTPDLALVARLEEITSDTFFDPDVMVVQEALAGADDEEGQGTYGAKVALRRRSAAEWRDDVAAPQVERPAPRARPTPEERLEGDRQAAIAAGEEESELVVLLSPEPTVVVPRQPTSPLPLTPIERTDLRLSRLEAMAARGQEIVELQAPFVEWLESEGGEVMSRHWIANRIHVRAPADLMPAIAARPDVRFVGRAARMAPEVPANRDVIRESIQVHDYLAAGYDGSRTSSRNGYGILMGIIEASDGLANGATNGFLDAGGGASRVVEKWDCDVDPCDGTLDACATTHGMQVASVAVADFMDGQDANIPANQRGERSGIAQESHMTLTTYSGEAGLVLSVEKAIEDGVDLVNHSAGDATYTCDPGDSDALPINDAYDDGILWINSAGNSTAWCEGLYNCRANDQSAAYGSVAVAAHSSAAPLEDNEMCTGSYGGASFGDVTDLAAPGGVYYPMNCSNGFGADTENCEGSSYAAPHVTGAAALLMDRWTASFGDAQAHQPGRMHSALLMMGDGCGDAGTAGLHGCWGAGRLRMRRFDTYGLDAPYKFKSERVVFSSGFTSYASDLNVSGGANQALSSDVDAFVAVAWCRHINIVDPGFVWLRLYDVDTSADAVSTAELGEKTRIMADPAAHRHKVILTVADVDWVAEGGTVDCYLTWLWEDSARDDANGPGATIEPYDITGAGPTCDNCCG